MCKYKSKIAEKREEVRTGGGEGEMQRNRDEGGSQKKKKKYGEKTGTR